MVVVSEFTMLAYKLNQNINGEKLLQSIQKLVHKTATDPNKEYLLIIKLQEICYNDDASIPKLEHHNLDQ